MLVESLLGVKDPKLAAVLQTLVRDRQVGRIALRIHAGEALEVRFKDLQLRVLGSEQ